MNALPHMLRHYWLWIAVTAIGLGVFVLSPGGYTSTSHALLHGLCAQTPSHTFLLDGVPLPFDARMTGIYGGILVTVLVLAVRGRIFCSGDLPVPVMGVLGLLIIAMAVDGFNSLFTDLQIGHLYVPTNLGRLATGYGTGVALGVALCWLVSASAWRMSKAEPGIRTARDLLVPVGGLALYIPVVTLGPGWMLFPVTVLLVVSAWMTTTMLALVIVLLAFRIDDGIGSLRALHVPVAIAAMLGIFAMLMLAAARFWLERTLGISNALM